VTYYPLTYLLKLKEGSERSARKILPMVIDLIKPESIIDIGCGLGCWLSVAMEYGIKDILGIDGEWIDKKALQIPDQYFRVHDLRKALNLERKFDLCLCLEVAEHLPSNLAEQLVNSLTGISDAILFSAAIPLQGGEDHVNEQWPDYWVSLFKKKGYVMIDYLRNKIWMDEDVEWWYAQNILLFVSPKTLRDQLTITLRGNTSREDIIKIHPKYWPANPWHLTKKALKLLSMYPFLYKRIFKSLLSYLPYMMLSFLRRRVRTWSGVKL
jgi:SAM-dependent methyltransferase